jgi:hypothetical protein
MGAQYLRAYHERAAAGAADEPGTPIRFVASTENVARDGLVIEADGWILDNFRSNPVILWAHDMMGARPPIGRAEKIQVQKKQLIADVMFDQNDEFARQIEQKYRDGFLNAVSVSWDTREFAPPKVAGAAPRITKAELLEISAVPLPSDPNALAQRQARALRDMAAELESLALPDPDPSGTRGAIAPHTTDAAPEDAPWDAGAELKKAEGADQYRKMCAWVNSDADPETRGAYKLPHHDADGKAVWAGVRAAMSRLMQANTDIPDADRRGVFNHLAKHYALWDKNPPEFHALDPDHIHTRDADPDTETANAWEDAAAAMVRLYLPDTRLTERERRRDYNRLAKAYRLAEREAPEWVDRDLLELYTFTEIRGLFLEGEPDLYPELFREPLLFAPRGRAGAVLSKRNQDDLKQAMSLIQAVLARAEKEAEQANTENDPERGQSDDNFDNDLATLLTLAPAGA